MNYAKLAVELMQFGCGTEDVNALPSDVANELEATDTVDYQVYEDDIKEVKTPDGINIIQLIAEPFTRYKDYIKKATYDKGMYQAYFKGFDSHKKAAAYINSVYAKNQNDSMQELDARFLKAYNNLSMFVENKTRMEKLWGTFDDPFLGEGIALTHELLEKLLLAMIPYKLNENTTLASVITKSCPEVSIKLLETAEYIVSIQSKLSKKIYYKAPLRSEITGERIDTVSKTKYDLINDPATRIVDYSIRPEERESSGFRDKNREVRITGAVESIDNIIEIRNNNALADFAKLVQDLTRIAYLGGVPRYSSNDMVNRLDKTFNSTSDVIGGIVHIIGEFNAKMVDPLNLMYKKFEDLRKEKTSITNEQFVSKDIEKSFAGRAAIAETKPKIDDFEY